MTNTAKYLKDYQVPDFFIDTVDLEFDLEPTSTTVRSTLTIRRNAKHNKPLILDGTDLTLLSVAIDGEQINEKDYEVTSTQLTISITKDEFTLDIETKINPEANTSLEGLYKSGDAFCTQCEAEGFRKITYYLDRPDVMAIFSTKIIATEKEYPYLLSNGNKVDSGKLEDGKHWVKWEDPFKKPCYLFALVAGDFDLLSDTFTTKSNREVVLEIFVDKGNLHKTQYAMTSLKNSMKWDEDVYGLEYDLDIYMIVAVDFFNMGAMENKGLNVFNSKFVLADETSATDVDFEGVEAVIGHEYFHNWTGNRVTCRDWFQLSLKEGLTVFRDQEFSADMGSRGVCRIEQAKAIRTSQFEEDSGPMAHPIRPEMVEEMNNFYTVTVYEKGAEVIRMLYNMLGKESYHAGIKLYFERFDGQAVTCDDFVDSLADASNVDLTLFKRWYSQSGTPSLKVNEKMTDEGYEVTFEQNTQPTHDQNEKSTLQIPIDFALIDDNGEKTVQQTLLLNKKKETLVFSQIKSKPTLVLLRGFSAPVQIEYTHSIKELIHTLKFEEDAFSRWDAAQNIYLAVLKARAVNDTSLDIEFIAAIRYILSNLPKDKALAAELLTLPSFDILAKEFDVCDPEVVSTLIHNMRLELSNQFESEWQSIYLKLDVVTNVSDSASRKLAAICIYYMAGLKNDVSNDIINQQFSNSKNMTNTLAVLNALKDVNFDLFNTLMARFENKWSNDSLVMDKWFSLFATQNAPDVVNKISELTSHKAFNFENPNRVRALFGAFAMRNPGQFHNDTGYKLLESVLVKLNEINPQVASRLITPLLAYKHFVNDKQALMKEVLVRLSKLPNLSTDLSEKISKALN